jgi:hypothetical protein
MSAETNQSRKFGIKSVRAKATLLRDQPLREGPREKAGVTKPV